MKQSVKAEPQALGRAIRKARKAAKLSQLTVADFLGIARTTLIAIEQGQRPLRIHELTRLAEILAINPTSLLMESEVNEVKEQLLSLSDTQARIIKRLTEMPLDPVIAKLVLNLYDQPQVQEAIASTLLHLLIQQEDDESCQSHWLQETAKGA
ncbi:MAG TPA: helix-turn-helix transcriptional regulator [Ktedonobacteraceae bacterium]|nr:helix-turn-helix transcriptional regulator [Ktedonobacteraceae bacterium]